MQEEIENALNNRAENLTNELSENVERLLNVVEKQTKTLQDAGKVINDTTKELEKMEARYKLCLKTLTSIKTILEAHNKAGLLTDSLKQALNLLDSFDEP